jgi:hypothetical protein
MQAALRLETTVLPGHRLELADLELAEGAKVEVIALLPQEAEPGRISMLEFLESLPPGAAPFRPERSTNGTSKRNGTSGIADVGTTRG